MSIFHASKESTEYIYSNIVKLQVLRVPSSQFYIYSLVLRIPMFLLGGWKSHWSFFHGLKWFPSITDTNNSISIIYLLLRDLRFQSFHGFLVSFCLPDLLSSWNGMGFTLEFVMWKSWFFLWQNEIVIWTCNPLHGSGIGPSSTVLAYGWQHIPLLLVSASVKRKYICIW